jgi:hypothetical protein
MEKNFVNEDGGMQVFGMVFKEENFNLEEIDLNERIFQKSPCNVNDTNSSPVVPPNSPVSPVTPNSLVSPVTPPNTPISPVSAQSSPRSNIVIDFN